MEGPVEELEPLFDYSRVQPIDLISLDDESLDSVVPIGVGGKKRKRAGRGNNHTEEKNGKAGCVVVNIDDDEGDTKGGKEEKEEDWLPSPPPKAAHLVSSFVEDQTIRELRLKKQELASFAQSAESVLKAVIETAKKEVGTTSGKSAVESVCKQSKPHVERPKIVISIQDKDGNRQFRIYKDDKFEGLFKKYAEDVKINLDRLAFCFDGDKVSPGASPNSLCMEDDDMIEVHTKRQ